MPSAYDPVIQYLQSRLNANPAYGAAQSGAHSFPYRNYAGMIPSTPPSVAPPQNPAPQAPAPTPSPAPSAPSPAPRPGGGAVREQTLNTYNMGGGQLQMGGAGRPINMHPAR